MTIFKFLNERKAEGLSNGEAMKKAFEFEQSGGRFEVMGDDEFVFFCKSQGYAEELIPLFRSLYIGN
ncbi:hypothetical protein [Sphaerochaeta globosa]|uniref:Uncharacterized protein n=1 Tax=Sphaerochaeta globosa (strain ATCC BAA-1886 / DSM 22777 / Buddy) TaxID=158189 RepID=F0RWP3_SPHGB|nr:hypothetical protein [Sphaerochaeta globosa]ADY13674.1 hypothetical protein SpiBuddy_1850 [Sphaerochaeta globosa str. Buddy]